MKKNTLIIGGLLMGLSLSVLAQNKEISHTDQQWFQYYGQMKFTKKWSIFPDMSYRWQKHLSQRAQYLLRAGAGYQFSPSTQLVVGMGHVGFFGTHTALRQVEYRPYQDLIVRKKWRHIKIHQRYRVEQRFFTRFAERSSPTQQTFNLRLRYRLAFGLPLLTQVQKQAHPQVSLQVASEILLNAGASVVYNVFDQHRVQVGAAIQLSKNWSITLTYSHHFIGLNTPGKFRVDEILWVGLRQTLDFSDKSGK